MFVSAKFPSRRADTANTSKNSKKTVQVHRSYIFQLTKIENSPTWRTITQIIIIFIDWPLGGVTISSFDCAVLGCVYLGTPAFAIFFISIYQNVEHDSTDATNERKFLCLYEMRVDWV